MSSVTAWVLSSLAASPCFSPGDQTAGWKRVAIPEAAPALAAPRGIDQFRSGESVLLYGKDEPRAYTGMTERHLGKTEYSFTFEAPAQHLAVEFWGDLGSAKVDATAFRSGSAFPLLAERRVRGRTVSLDWTQVDAQSVVVTVHHHARPRPVVAHWRVGWTTVVTGEEWEPPEALAPRSLYFRHPGGRELVLCEAPAQRLEVDRTRFRGVPELVSLGPRR